MRCPRAASSVQRSTFTVDKIATVPPLLTLPVHEVLSATPRSRVVRIALGGRTFPFDAGQAVRVGAHGSTLRKPYSLASGPERVEATGQIELLMQVDEAGIPGEHLPVLAPGTPLDIEGPLGTFTCPARPPERHFLFVAGGTGIAPLRAMMQHVVALGRDDRIALLYSARTPDQFAFRDELLAEAAAGRIQLQLTATRDGSAEWSGARGRISRTHLEALVTDRDTLCFLCGPPALVSGVAPLLRELGIDPARIRTEQWGNTAA